MSFRADAGEQGPPKDATTPKDPDLSKRTVAIHTGYVGTAYKGSCVNRALGEGATIEDLLERAIFKAGLMLESNFGKFSRTKWSRASRTDKGVHSLGTVMGLRMLVDERCYALKDASGAAVQLIGADTSHITDACEPRAGDVEGFAMAARINAHLPDNVRVFAVQKVNKKFNARHMCADRTYEYYLPASLINLKCDGSEEDARIIALLRQTLKLYEGYHPFHNFTNKKDHEAGRQPGPTARSRTRELSRNEEDKAARLAAAGAGGAGSDAAAAGAGGAGSGAAVQGGQQGEGQDDAPGAAEQAGGGQGGDDAQHQTARAAGGAAGVDVQGGEQHELQQHEQQQQQGQAGQGIGGDGGGNGGGGGGDRGGGSKGWERQDKGGRGPRKRGRDDSDGDNEAAAESDQESEGELDGDDDVLAGFIDTNKTATAAVMKREAGGSGAPTDAAAAGGGGGGVVKEEEQPSGVPRHVKTRGSVMLKFLEQADPKDVVSKTFYRSIKSFTADEPVPLVAGGTPCLKLEVHGQSFMLHHIRHMIGAAVAVARELIPLEVVEASLNVPSRVGLPRAPPHTLILSDCTFHGFPRQFGTGDNDLVHVTGQCLSLREGGTARKEAFRQQVLLPALQQLVELPDWDVWSRAIEAAYPWDPQHVATFLDTNSRWVATMKARREERQAAREEAALDTALFTGSSDQRRAAKRHNPNPQQRERQRGGRGRGRGGGRGGRGARVW